MCELYVKADPILYESRSRSLRIRGVVTTLPWRTSSGTSSGKSPKARA